MQPTKTRKHISETDIMKILFYLGSVVILGVMVFSIYSSIVDSPIDILIIGITMAVGWIALVAGSL